MMAYEERMRILERRNVRMRGHFVLASGRHSGDFFNFKRGVSPYPDDLARMCADLAELMKPLKPDGIICPVIGGLGPAFEVANQYNLANGTGIPCLYAKKLYGDDAFFIGRGFGELINGRRVLVVDHDLKKGRSSQVTAAVRSCGGTVVGLTGLYSSRDTSPMSCDAPDLKAFDHANEINWMLPWSVAEFATRLADPYQLMGVEAVVGTAIRGLLLAQYMARRLIAASNPDVISVFAEQNAFDDGLFIPDGIPPFIQGRKFCVFDDVVTTGKNMGKTARLVQSCGGEVVGGITFCIRGKTTAADLDIPILIGLDEFRDVESWEESELPEWLKRIPVNTDVGHGREYLARLAKQQSQ